MKKTEIEKSLAYDYHELAFMNLTVALYEVLENCRNTPAQGRMKDLFEEILSALSEVFSESAAPIHEQEANRLQALRETVGQRTEALFGLEERLVIPEYLLYRAEYRFVEVLPEVDNQAEAREILRAVFSSDDSLVINQRIQDMVFCLPVRMTKQKFIQLVQNSLLAYQGGESSAMQAFSTRLKATAGICLGQRTEREDWEAFADELSALDFSTLTKEQLAKVRERLCLVEAALEEELDFGCNLQQVLNNALCIVLVCPYLEKPSAAKEHFLPFAKKILAYLQQGAASGKYKEISEKEMTDIFSWMEGKIEAVYERTGRLANKLDDASEKPQGIIGSLLQAEKLMSSSLFSPLEEEASKLVTPEEMESCKNDLAEQLLAAMEGKNRKYVRALMAGVLKELPVFFDSHTDVMNYVLASLDGCSDLAEKNAALAKFWEAFDE